MRERLEAVSLGVTIGSRPSAAESVSLLADNLG
jgi:hypothetical protein